MMRKFAIALAAFSAIGIAMPLTSSARAEDAKMRSWSSSTAATTKTTTTINQNGLGNEAILIRLLRRKQTSEFYFDDRPGGLAVVRLDAAFS